MYVPASDGCNMINIDIDTGSSVTRTWQIKVTQYECKDLKAPEEDCLQYHTAETGEKRVLLDPVSKGRWVLPNLY